MTRSVDPRACPTRRAIAAGLAVTVAVGVTLHGVAPALAQAAPPALPARPAPGAKLPEPPVPAPVLDDAATARSIALATELHRRGHYYREIGALEELALFAPRAPQRAWARLRIALAYRAGDQHDAAVDALDELLTERLLDPPTEALARVERALARAEAMVLEAGRPRAVDVIAELTPAATGAGPARFHALVHQARLHAVLGDTREVRATLAAAEAACAGTACADLARVRAALARPRPATKRSAVAIGLSAVVPGAGSAYAGHHVDGLYYLGLTTAAALGAWDVHDADRSLGDQRATFWGLATLSGFFYVSSLVNAYLSVERHNDVKLHRWRDQLWRGSALPTPLTDLPPPP